VDDRLNFIIHTAGGWYCAAVVSYFFLFVGRYARLASSEGKVPMTCYSVTHRWGRHLSDSIELYSICWPSASIVALLGFVLFQPRRRCKERSRIDRMNTSHRTLVSNVLWLSIDKYELYNWCFCEDCDQWQTCTFTFNLTAMIFAGIVNIYSGVIYCKSVVAFTRWSWMVPTSMRWVRSRLADPAEL
jgi:hypothetical protein